MKDAFFTSAKVPFTHLRKKTVLGNKTIKLHNHI